MCLVWSLVLIRHLHSNGMWLGLAPRANIKKTHVWKKLGYMLQNMITILGAIVNTTKRNLYNDPNEHLHFDNECDTYTSSKNNEESGDRLHLALVTSSSRTNRVVFHLLGEVGYGLTLLIRNSFIRHSRYYGTFLRDHSFWVQNSLFYTTTTLDNATLRISVFTY